MSHYHDAICPPGSFPDCGPYEEGTMNPNPRHVRPKLRPRPRPIDGRPCGRHRFYWPWWCSREAFHPGPCALYRKPWRIW